MEWSTRRREPCAVCELPVFLAQRLRVGGRLYHRTCFRCERCSTQLSLADAYETCTGVWVCETCPDEMIVPEETPAPLPPDPPPSLVASRRLMFDTDDAKLLQQDHAVNNARLVHSAKKDLSLDVEPSLSIDHERTKPVNITIDKNFSLNPKEDNSIKDNSNQLAQSVNNSTISECTSQPRLKKDSITQETDSPVAINEDKEIDVASKNALVISDHTPSFNVNGNYISVENDSVSFITDTNEKPTKDDDPEKNISESSLSLVKNNENKGTDTLLNSVEVVEAFNAEIELPDKLPDTSTELGEASVKEITPVNTLLKQEVSMAEKKADPDYPEGLNPFEESEGEEPFKASTNPFGSESEEESPTPVTRSTYQVSEGTPRAPPRKPSPRKLSIGGKSTASTNPFESDEEDESIVSNTGVQRGSLQSSPEPTPFPRRSKLRTSARSITSLSSICSSTSPRKKRPAPPPPTSTFLSPSSRHPSISSLASVRSRKTKRAPPPPAIQPTLSPTAVDQPLSGSVLHSSFSPTDCISPVSLTTDLCASNSSVDNSLLNPSSELLPSLTSDHEPLNPPASHPPPIPPPDLSVSISADNLPSDNADNPSSISYNSLLLNSTDVPSSKLPSGLNSYSDLLPPTPSPRLSSSISFLSANTENQQEVELQLTIPDSSSAKDLDPPKTSISEKNADDVLTEIKEGMKKLISQFDQEDREDTKSLNITKEKKNHANESSKEFVIENKSITTQDGVTDRTPVKSNLSSFYDKKIDFIDQESIIKKSVSDKKCQSMPLDVLKTNENLISEISGNTELESNEEAFNRNEKTESIIEAYNDEVLSSSQTSSVLRFDEVPPPVHSTPVKKVLSAELLDSSQEDVGSFSSPPASYHDSSSYQESLASPPMEKKHKDSVNFHTKIIAEGSYVPHKSVSGQWKRKKGPAPALPALPLRRNIKPMAIHHIRQQLADIEVKQQELERQGVALEQKIRSRFDSDTSISPYLEDLVLQLFELVNEKNELFRKQAELMYLRRQNQLEEEHAELEYQIRCLMACPEANKTDSDKELEENLILRLVEVVERRDAIIQCLEMDRLREAEEDRSITRQLDNFTRGIAADERTKFKKKHKKKKDFHQALKAFDLDKDLDESEKDVKRKKKWYTLQHKGTKHM